MTYLLLVIHVLFYPPTGGRPVEVEQYEVRTYRGGYLPDSFLFGDTYSPVGFNPCMDVAEGVIKQLQRGTNQYDALLPGSNETITYELKCEYYI